MPKTPSNNYSNITESLKRISVADMIISENLHNDTLAEAVDEQTWKTAEEVVQKLSKMNLKDFPHISKGIQLAMKDVDDYRNAGKIGKAAQYLKQDVKNMFGGRGMQPIQRAATFASCIENGFQKLPSMLKANIENIDEKKDVQLIQCFIDIGEEEKKTAASPLRQFTQKMNPDQYKSTKEWKNLEKKLLAIFTPRGIIFSSGNLPYISSDDLIADLSSATLERLSAVYDIIKSVPVPDLSKADPPAKNVKKTTTGTNPTQAAEPGASPKSTAPTTPASTAQKPAPGGTQSKSINVDKLLQNSNLNAKMKKNVVKLLKQLASAGKITINQ